MSFRETFPAANETTHRVHLAKVNPNGECPYEALINGEFEGWQTYRGSRKERFIRDIVIAFAKSDDNNYLFGGVYEITSRDGEEYEVRRLCEQEERIRQLEIEYFGENKRSSVFTPEYVNDNCRVLNN